MSRVFFNRIETKDHRRDLRKNATPQEVLLWSRLRSGQLGVKFRRQHAIGPYIVDFYCIEKKFAIEIDGSQHFEETAVLYDKRRTQFLEAQGCTMIRFPNNEININLDGVLMLVVERLGAL
jgi:type I restriction enzyme M protein